MTLGFTNMAVLSTGAVFQPLIGALLDWNWSGAMAVGARLYALCDFKTALVVFPACSVVALVAAAFTRETYCRPVDAD